MAITIPNITRVRGTTETTVADALHQTQQYINRNVNPIKGNARAVPRAGSRPVLPVRK